MKVEKYLKIKLVIFLIGTAISLYLVYHHYSILNGNTAPSFCSVSSEIDCDAVNSSKYSEIKIDIGNSLFRLPLATAGLVYCLFALLLTLIAKLNSFHRREAITFLFLSSIGSVFVSLTMAGISFFILKVLCIMCLSLQTLTLLGFLATFFAFKNLDDSITETKKKLKMSRFSIYVLFGLIIFFVTHAATYYGFYSPIPEPIINKSDFLNKLEAQPAHNIDISGSNALGNTKNPKLTIVEFADFECPTCAQATLLMHKLLKDYGNDIQVVFKNFPLDMSCNPAMTFPLHKFSCEAARASYCAFEQGKFESYAFHIFENQSNLSSENLKVWAKKLELDRDKFDACINSDRAKAAVLKEIMQGKDLNVEVTPTFFINGKKHEGTLTEVMLRALLK